MGAEKNVENHIKQSLAEHDFWYTRIFANAYTVNNSGLKSEACNSACQK